MIGLLAALLFCFAAIFVSGGFLTTLGDRISENSSLGHHVMGMFFLAAVTSLPELSAGLAAAGISRLPDIAVGEILGSCVFNLTILGVADLLSRRPVIAARGRAPFLNGVTGFVLLVIAALALRTPGPAALVSWLAGGAIAAVYMAGLVGVRRLENKTQTQPRTATPGTSLTKLWLQFAAASLLVIGPGLWLPSLAATLSREAGISESLVGTFLVGAFTSAPEMIVTWHCLRRGWTVMALGNLMGSNLFNILILVPMDAVYTGGSLYRAAGGEHLFTVLAAMAMTAMVILAGVWRRRAVHTPRFRAEGVLLLVAYAAVFFFLVSR
ncbi:MAG: sodium:calcium antiporter [Acidobacteria bacterium]|nr:MAG: sodium:calcium antiporter [Acidobacteriota bacterium]